MYWQLHNWTKEGKLLQFDEDIFRELPDSIRFSIIRYKRPCLRMQRHVHVLDGLSFTIIARIIFCPSSVFFAENLDNLKSLYSGF